LKAGKTEAVNPVIVLKLREKSEPIRKNTETMPHHAYVKFAGPAAALSRVSAAAAPGGEWTLENKFLFGRDSGNSFTAETGRLVRELPITARKVRLRITGSPVCPALSEVGLFFVKP
jgi:hypothetical protein